MGLGETKRRLQERRTAESMNMGRSMFAPIVQTSGWTRPPSKLGYAEFGIAVQRLGMRGRHSTGTMTRI